MSKIGILGAMPEEISSIQAHMTDVIEEEHAGRKFIQGRIHTIDIVLVFSRWGKVAAATTVTLLIEKYTVDQIIFSGVAGALLPELNIGDVVISTQLYQHDMDARPLMPKHEIPLTGIQYFQAHHALIETADLSTKDFFKFLSQKISPESLAAFSIVNPKIVHGIIATGDEFVHTTERGKIILSENAKTCAVEMEGAAVAQVCADFKIPFVIIRTISDRADHVAKINFPAFVAEIAQHYSEHIVMGMLAELAAIRPALERERNQQSTAEPTTAA